MQLSSYARKALASGLAVSTILSSAMAFAPQFASAAVHTDGCIVISNGTAWYITGGTRRGFPSAEVFMSYGYNFGQLAAASTEDLALPVGPIMVYADGTLVKGPGDPLVYLVTSAQKRGFTSGSVFSGLGFSFVDVQQAPFNTFADLPTGANIDSTTMAHPAGVTVLSNGTVWLMTSTGRMGYPSMAVFLSRGMTLEKVVPANAADMAMPDSGVVTMLTGCSGGISPTPPPSGPVSVSLASDNPAGGTIVTGQATADLLHFTLTGNGTVQSITLHRSGISDQSTLTNVYLYDGNTRLTDGFSFNSNGDITMSNLNLAVNGSRTISVKADVFASGTSGQTISVAVTSVMVTGGTPVASNVSGNTFTVANGTGVLASASFTAANTVTAATVNAGTTAYTFWSAPLQINTRTVQLKSAAFRMVGSAPADALSNIKLFVDGVDSGKAGTMSVIQGSNYIMFDATSAPVSLTTGSHTIDVRANIEKGSSRTVQLSVQQAADLMIFDPQVGVNIAVSGTPNSAGLITIGPGSATVVNDPAFQALTNVTGGASNVPVAKFKLHAYGEDVKVNTVQITPLVAAGTSTGGATATANLTTGGVSSVTVVSGGSGYTVAPTVTYSSPQIQATATANATATVATMTNVGSGYIVTPTVTVATGTSNCTTNPTATATVTNFTVSSIALAGGVGCTTGAVTLTVAAPTGVTASQPGNTGVTISGGGSVTAIAAPTTSGSGYAAAPTVTVAGPGATFTSLDDVTLYFNGSQVGTQQDWTGTGTLTYTLGSQMIIAAGADATLEVRANIRTPAGANYTSGTVRVTLNKTASENAQGQSSFTPIFVPTADVSGNPLTIQTGLLAVAKNTGFANQNVNPNTAGVRIGSFVLQNQSSSESVRVTSLKVDLGGSCAVTNLAGLKTSESSGSGATPVQPQATNTFSVDFTLAMGATKTIDILADTSSTTGCTVITTLTVTSIGVSSNVSATSAATVGQTVTVQSGTVANPPTFQAASSSPAQFVAAGNGGVVGAGGATDATNAQFNFVSTNAASTITELKFVVTPNPASTPVTAVKVGSVSAPVVTVGGVQIAYLTGLNITVPNGGSGATVNALVSYAEVGTSGIAPGTQAHISLDYVKYTSGGTTTTMCSVAVGTCTGNVLTAVVAPDMTMVGSKPTLVIPSAQQTGLNPSSSVMNKIGEVTVTADAKGNIKVNDIVFTVSSSGFFTAPTAIGTPVISSSNSSSAPVTGSFCGATGLVVTCEFGNPPGAGESNTDFDGLIVAPGTPITLSLFGSLTGASTSGSTGTPTVSSSIGASTFNWDDTSTNGASGTNLTGALIFNFPNNSFSITQ